MLEFKIETFTDVSSPSVIEYFKVRSKAYNDKLSQTLYDNPPTQHDTRKGTIFLVFKTTDPSTGKEIVFGGRRLVLPEHLQPTGTLPFERKHKVIKRKEANRFQSLRQKELLDATDVLPALKLEKGMVIAELGAFAIDQEITRRLFTAEEYKCVRERIYAASLDAARKAGIDIVIIGPHRNNLKNQMDWLRTKGSYEFRQLGKTKDMFTNPLPSGMESEIIIINTSGKYTLIGPGSILRYNQDEASKVRGNGNLTGR